MKSVYSDGFTLAEMLIALALIGVISALLIPKLLFSSNTDAKKVMVLQTASAITQAYQTFAMDNHVTAATSANDLRPQFNVVETLTAGNLDGSDVTNTGTGDTSWSCAGAMTCVRMHTGAYVGYWNGGFGGTTDLNSLWFLIDTDGSPSTNGRATNYDNSIWLVLYRNGNIRSWENVLPGTLYINGTGDLTAAVPFPNSNPSWFQGVF